jgi:hypothetical protein
MREILDIALKFQGILGAAVGVIATLITTSLIKKLGRIYIYFRGWKMNISKRDGAGGLEPSTLEDANYCDYSFEMEIINTSETPRALRDIKVNFYNSNKLLLETIPRDDSTKKSWTGGTITDSLKIINLPSKQMVYYKISGYIKSEDLKNLSNYKKIYFEALSHSRQKVKKLIHKN